MLRKVQKYIIENNLLLSGRKPIIVGVSGGSDSIVLLNVLQKLGYNCIIAHCNFHLRMEESNRDEEFVRALSKSTNTPIETIDFKTLEYASANNISMEMAARNLRYSWFEDLLLQYNAQAIAVGHHLDDNVETILINLSRGTGLKGLTGIPVRNENVVRPLLGTSRNEIKQYIDQHNLKFVEDSTNLSTDIIRNKIRLQLIPLLEEINPSFRMSMVQTRKNLEDAYNIFQDSINDIKNNCITISENRVTINIHPLQTSPEKATILYEILKTYHFHPDQASQIADSLDADAGKMFYSSTHVLLKDRENIIIQRIEDLSFNNLVDQTDQQKTALQFRVFEKDTTFEYSRNQQTIHLDADKVNLPFKQRSWQAADYFFPLGMKHKKKLSDFLIDEKIDRFEKQDVQVLISGDQIVWVIGLRMDDRFKVTKDTQNIVEVSL